MSLVKKLLQGPYPFWPFMIVVALGAAGITGTLVPVVGWLTYQGHATIPGATHISETFFTGFLATFITGIVLHRHASMGGSCLTLDARGRCPFLGIFLLGLSLGAFATVYVVIFQGTGAIAFQKMLCTKTWQGLVTGLSLPFLFHALGLLKHPKVIR